MEKTLMEFDTDVLDNIALTAMAALGHGPSVAECGPVATGTKIEALRGLKSIRDAIKYPGGKPPKTKKKYKMLLTSVGNPDHGQYSPVSNPKWVDGDTLQEMQDHATEYQSYWNLGNGNWTNPEVHQGKKIIGHFGYNGGLYPGTAKDHYSKPVDQWPKKIEIKEGM